MDDSHRDLAWLCCWRPRGCMRAAAAVRAAFSRAAQRPRLPPTRQRHHQRGARWRGRSRSPGPRRAPGSCGFYFDPGKLRTSYIAYESQQGAAGEQLAKIEKMLRHHLQVIDQGSCREGRVLHRQEGRRDQGRSAAASGRRLHAQPAQAQGGGVLRRPLQPVRFRQVRRAVRLQEILDQAGRQSQRPPLESRLPVAQLTPSFFCSDVDDVVYWNSSFLPG